MIEIGLLRHFPTDWNAAGRLQGRTDVPLSQASREELKGRRLPERWRGLPIICSPLSRAAETATLLSESGPPRHDPRLIEFDFGDWEGRFGKELIADPDAAYGPVETWGPDFRPPNGETPAEMTARLLVALRDVAETGPSLLVVHRGVMRAILAVATGWAWRGPETFRIKRAAVHPVMLSEDGTPVAAGPWEKLDIR